MPIRARRPLETLEQTSALSTTGELFEAGFEEAAAAGPVNMAGAQLAVTRTEERDVFDEYATVRFGAPLGPRRQKLTQAEAQARVKSAGVEVEVPLGGMTDEGVGTLIRRRQAEQRRATLFAQSDGSWGQRIATLGAGFVGMATDPLNLGSAFVPVVGEARYAQWLARAGLLGRTGIRIGVGGLEGAAGIAAIEPLTYGLHQQLQDDYDAYDSLRNIASGVVFGGALHAGAGLFGDSAGRALGWTPEWQQVRLRQALDDELARQARQADTRQTAPIAPEARVEPEATPVAPPPEFSPEAWARAQEEATVLDRLAEGRPLTREAAETEAAAAVFDRLRAFVATRAEAGAVAGAKAEIAAITARIERHLPEREAALTRQLAQTRRGNQPAKQANATAAKRAREIVGRERAVLEGRRAELQAAIDHYAGLAEFESIARSGDLSRLPESLRTAVAAEADRRLGSSGRAPLATAVRQALDRDPFMSIRPLLARVDASTQQTMFRVGLAQAMEGRPVDVTPALLADTRFAGQPGTVQAIREGVQRNATAQHLADPQAPVTAQARLDAEPAHADALAEVRAAAQSVKQDTEAWAKENDLGDVLDTHLKDANAALREARSAGKAAQAAAACLMGVV